jgi:hypothetical protein
VVTLVSDGGVRHGIPSVYGTLSLRRKHDFRRPNHSTSYGVLNFSLRDTKG